LVCQKNLATLSEHIFSTQDANAVSGIFTNVYVAMSL
jgi:hypothetical protein